MFNQEAAKFDVVWDGLFSNDNIVEISFEEFEQKYGINALQFDEALTEATAPESNYDDQNNTNVTVQNEAKHLTQSIPNEFKNIELSDVRQYITKEENKNTAKKTLNDTKKFQRFLLKKGETREMHQLDVDVLDEHIATFILSLQRQDGTEYEPISIRAIISSLERKLKRHKYPFSIMNEKGPQFSLTRETYNAKKKRLKKEVKITFILNESKCRYKFNEN